MQTIFHDKVGVIKLLFWCWKIWSQFNNGNSKISTTTLQQRFILLKIIFNPLFSEVLVLKCVEKDYWNDFFLILGHVPYLPLQVIWVPTAFFTFPKRKMISFTERSSRCLDCFNCFNRLARMQKCINSCRRYFEK